MKQFNVTINFADYTVKTQMLSQYRNICPDNEKVYMWYASQKIMETKGGFDGKLIHGTYRSFYLNDQLKEKGQIRYGLRNKEWKYWYPDGHLKEVINWKDGIKSGTYMLYNDYGQLVAKGRFKRDKLHGKFYTYTVNGKVADKKKYKNGDEKAPRVKKEKVKKKNASAENKVGDKNKKTFPLNLFRRNKIKTDSAESIKESPIKKNKAPRIRKKKETMESPDEKKSQRKSVTT